MVTYSNLLDSQSSCDCGIWPWPKGERFRIQWWVFFLCRLATGQLQWIQLLHSSLQIALSCSKLYSSHDAFTSHNVLFHYSKFPLISVFVVVFDKAHISLLNSARRVFMCYGVTFSQPTKVPFRSTVPNRILAFSEVFCSSRLFLHPERLLSAHQRLDRRCR